MASVEIFPYEEVVDIAYELVFHILDDTWTPKARRELLISHAPYFDQIVDAGEEAYRRVMDDRSSKYERRMAGRDGSVLNIAMKFLFDFVTVGRFDERMEILISIP